MTEASFSITQETAPNLTPVNETSPDVDAEITDHADLIQTLLIERFSGPRNLAFLEAIGTQVQEIETCLWDFQRKLDLDVATGDMLDMLGTRVSELRLGKTDDQYRYSIYTKMLILRANGTIPEMIVLAKRLRTNTTDVVYVRELQPMTLEINYNTAPAVAISYVGALLRKAKAGGVRLLVGYGAAVAGAVDGAPLGGTVGAVDGDPLGFTIGGAG